MSVSQETETRSGADSVLRLDGIVKRYDDVVALDGVTLTVSGNEYVSLLGPSGSGKTSLLRVIAGFERPEAGRVHFRGADVTDVSPHQRGIGFVFQNFALFPHMSVLKNVTYGLANADEGAVSAEVAERRARAMLEMVGLSGLESRGVDQISGGQKQRVALARTLVKEPQLVLLDEPLGALDANLRARMRNELRTIRKELGVTFLHVTGSESEALAMGDRVAVLDRGRVLQFGAPGTVYDAPSTPNVARFLNRYNLFAGSLHPDGGFEGPFGKVPAPRVQPADEALYGIRYDRVTVEPENTAADAPALHATFRASEYLGSSVIYFFETDAGKIVESEHHMSLGTPPEYRAGARYTLRWKPEHAIVFG
ncbi:MAG: ABC transporter ATP-binding protein [Pararhodobacter sp.]